MKKTILTNLIVFTLCLAIVSLAEANLQCNTTQESCFFAIHPTAKELIIGSGWVHTITSMKENGKGFTHIKYHINAKFSGDGYILGEYIPSGVTYEGKETLNIEIKQKSSSLGPGYHYTKTMMVMLRGSDGSSCKLHTNYHFKIEDDGTINTFIDDYKIKND